jgi:hypothetical protein
VSQPNPDPATAGASLVYRIDGANRITWVNDRWSGFARANGGEGLLPEQILGHDLTTSLADPTVRQLYATMIQQVRAGKFVRFDYRCDAPDKRRTFTMEIRRRPDGEVEFSSTLRHEEPRPAVALLKPDAPRDQERFVRMCSWCQNVALPSGDWVPVEEAVQALNLMEADRLPRITHTMCGPCHARAMSSLG